MPAALHAVKKHQVADKFKIALDNTSVILVGEDDLPYVLPLLTMTGISSLKPKR